MVNKRDLKDIDIFLDVVDYDLELLDKIISRLGNIRFTVPYKQMQTVKAKYMLYQGMTDKYILANVELSHMTLYKIKKQPLDMELMRLISARGSIK